MKIIRYKDIAEVEKEGYSVKNLAGLYETSIPKGNKCSYHYHENLYEVIIFLTKSRVKANGKIFNVRPMDMLLLNPHDMHEFIAKDNDVKLLAIKIPNIINDKVRI